MLTQLQDGILTLVVLFGLALLLSVKRWPEWLRRARSAHWPTVAGTIESGEVSTLRGKGRYSDRMIERATASLAYSYQLNGTYYSGYMPRLSTMTGCMVLRGRAEGEQRSGQLQAAGTGDVSPAAPVRNIGLPSPICSTTLVISTPTPIRRRL